MEDSTSNTFIRNEPEAIIFFRDVYHTGGPVVTMEGVSYSL